MIRDDTWPPDLDERAAADMHRYARESGPDTPTTQKHRERLAEARRIRLEQRQAELARQIAERQAAFDRQQEARENQRREQTA